MTIPAIAVEDEALRFPHSIDAEKAVLGGILTRPEMLAAARSLVRASDFYRQAHQLVFDRLCVLADAGTPPDLVLLTENLRLTGDLDRANGAAALADLLDARVTAGATPDYARVVAQLSRRRAAIHAVILGNDTVAAALLDDMRTATGATVTFRSACEILNEPPLTWLIDHVIPSRGLVVLFGRRGVGKTQLATLLALTAAGAPVGGFVSDEAGTVLYDDREWSLAGRLAAAVAHHGVPAPERLPIVRPQGSLMDLADAASVRRFIAEARRESVRPVLTIIDTLSRAADYDENRDGSLIVRSCDLIRHQLGGAIVLITHPGEGNADRPRGGNQIEGAADMVLKLASNKAGAIELSSIKDRNGPPGRVIRTFSLTPVASGVTLSPIMSVGGSVLSQRDESALAALQSCGQASHGDWKAAAAAAGLSTGQFNSALTKLTEGGRVVKDGDTAKYRLV